MRSRKLLALIFTLLAIAPALAGYMTLLGAGVGSIQPIVSWVSTTDPTFPSSSLTFSRTSLATMFDSTGKLTYAPNNLLTYSNTFSNAAWTKTNVTLAAGQTDPLGGSNATRVTATGANGQLYQAISSQPTLLSTLWVRRISGSGNVNLFTPAGGTGALLSLTGSWQQFTQPPGTGGIAGIIVSTSGDAIDVYAATASAVTYETSPRAADQVITTSAAYYGPRIDYDPNTLAVKGLLIEEARTNIVLQNRDLTNAAWTKGATVTVAKDQTGIDGVANSASSITGGAVSGTNTVLQSITLASSTRAQSAWVKRLVGSGTVNMTTDGGSTWNAITLTGSWTRVQFSQAAVTNPNVGFQVTTLNDQIAVDFVQNETGAFATSSLQTAASSVTRAADVVQFTGAALTAASGSAATLISEWDAINASLVVSAPTQFGMTGGYPLLRINNATTLLAMSTAGNSASLTVASGTWDANFRVGLAYNSSGFTLAANGASASSAAAFTSPSTVYVGNLNGVANYSGNHHLRSFAIYNQRLPDATLQAKSVVGASYAANDNGVRFAFANDNLPVHWRIAL